MGTHLESGAADQCVKTCGEFVTKLESAAQENFEQRLAAAPGAFDTARQIGTVYELFAGTDLQMLLNGYIDQVKAMAMLFAAAGGLIEAQDEQLASALGKAAQEPSGMVSLGLAASMGPAAMAMAQGAQVTQAPGGYGRVGPEEVSGAPLARLVSGAKALDPAQYVQVKEQVRTVATDLSDATATLTSGLRTVLGSQWEGEFTQAASASLNGFETSVDGLVDSLHKVAAKAERLEGGYTVTRANITEQATQLEYAEALRSGGTAAAGPPTPGAREAAEQAAAEQARAIVNTEYSPAVMDANLDDLDFPTAYRVVSGAAVGGPSGIDLVRAWNGDGVIHTAGAAAPPESALTAATGGGAGAGASGGSPTSGWSTTTTPSSGVDATTHQALVASGAGTSDLGGQAGASAVGAGAGLAAGAGAQGSGLNAATTAAAAPMMAAAQQSALQNGQSGAANGRVLGRDGRDGRTSRGRDRDHGFGNASGLIGGGGAAAAGAAGAAARMGGAGTLSGLGGAGTLSGVGGAGGTGAGAAGGAGGAAGGSGSGAGAGSAGSGAAGGPKGAFSSSSIPPGAAAGGRAGMVPAGMMGAMGAQGQGDRREHTHASYLVSATNTSEILGEPPKASPAVLGRSAPEDIAASAPAAGDRPATNGESPATNGERSAATGTPAAAAGTTSSTAATTSHEPESDGGGGAPGTRLLGRSWR